MPLVSFFTWYRFRCLVGWGRSRFKSNKISTKKNQLFWLKKRAFYHNIYILQQSNDSGISIGLPERWNFLVYPGKGHKQFFGVGVGLIWQWFFLPSNAKSKGRKYNPLEALSFPSVPAGYMTSEAKVLVCSLTRSLIQLDTMYSTWKTDFVHSV